MAVEHADKYRAPALEKGIDILELLAEVSDGMSQAEIAKSLGRSANEIYRMLATLERRGYLVKSETGDQYQMSMKLYILAHRHPPMRRLLEHAMPMMQETADKINQSVQIGLLEGSNVVIPQVVLPQVIASSGHVGFSLRSGSTIGLYNTGTGRVLAAFSSAERRDGLIENHELVHRETFRERVEFDEVLNQIRLQGFEQMISAIYHGVVNLVYPIFGPHEGIAIAALGTPYLTRIGDAHSISVEQAKKEMAETARSLSIAFGAKLDTKTA